jgi:hypothetical protein
MVRNLLAQPGRHCLLLRDETARPMATSSYLAGSSGLHMRTEIATGGPCMITEGDACTTSASQGWDSRHGRVC